MNETSYPLSAADYCKHLADHIKKWRVLTPLGMDIKFINYTSYSGLCAIFGLDVTYNVITVQTEVQLINLLQRLYGNHTMHTDHNYFWPRREYEPRVAALGYMEHVFREIELQVKLTQRKDSK